MTSTSGRPFPHSPIENPRVTPSATSENNWGVIRPIANLSFYRRFWHPPSTEAPSFHRVTCTLAKSPSDSLHQRLQQFRCLHCCSDCYPVERTSSGAGLGAGKE